VIEVVKALISSKRDALEFRMVLVVVQYGIGVTTKQGGIAVGVAFLDFVKLFIELLI
jgi:hypothetical protein